MQAARSSSLMYSQSQPAARLAPAISPLFGVCVMTQREGLKLIKASVGRIWQKICGWEQNKKQHSLLN